MKHRKKKEKDEENKKMRHEREIQNEKILIFLRKRDRKKIARTR